MFLYLLVVGIVMCWILYWKPQSSFPSLVPGLPILGNSVALGKYGVVFLKQCRKKFGDTYTLDLLGQKMMFLYDPAMIEVFFKAPDADITFRPAVEQFTQRVFGLPSKKFFPVHSQILSDLRQLLVPGNLAKLGSTLGHSVFQQLEEVFPTGQEVELFASTKELVYVAGVRVLFGAACTAALSKEEAKEIRDAFFEFEAGFEKAASPIPHIFQPQFCASRRRLLTWLRSSYEADHFKHTVVGDLVEKSGLPREHAPNMLLALLWASQANTVSATFWAIAYLCLPQHACFVEEIRAELAAALSIPVADLTSHADQEALTTAATNIACDRRSAASRVVAEAVRLRVHSIDVRIAARQLSLRTSQPGSPPVSIPKGTILAVCPFISHGDSTLYGDDPEVFDPSRKGVTLVEGSALNGAVAGLAFGGGVYRCPGRFFAEMEVALILQLVIAHRDLQMLSLASSSRVMSSASSSTPSSTTCQTSKKSKSVGLIHIMKTMFSSIFGCQRWDWGIEGGLKCEEAGVEDEVREKSSNDDRVRKEGGVALADLNGGQYSKVVACDMIRLVGLKIPSEPCLVLVKSSQ